MAENVRRVQANGLSFLIGERGSGPKLLYLSGTNGDLRKANSPLRSPLVDSFSLLTFDQRGLGQTDKPDVAYSMQDYATDAVAILDTVGWDKVCVAGYSFGGMVAQELAIRWPERVAKLVLMATTAGGAGGSSTAIEKFDKLPPAQRARQRLEIINLSFTPQWQIANPIEAQARIDVFMESEALYADEPGSALGRRRQLEARALHNTYDQLENISMPTLVICGDRDGQAPRAAQQAMASRISNSQWEMVEGTHGMITENPRVYELLTDFLHQ